MKYRYLAIALVIGALGLGAVAIAHDHHLAGTQDHSQMHQDHMNGVNKRGDQAMGFDHTKTTHHFILTNSGGSIQVEANDAQDHTSRDQIRMHLSHIAELFSAGDFEIPMIVHDKVPPGVPVMKSLKAAITYKYEELEKGGRVLIVTKDPAAIAGIHEFLRFQIQDHQTGDPVEVK